MSAGITEQDALAFTGETPWHGIGTPFDHLMTPEEIVTGDGPLAWTVSKRQIAVPMPDGTFAPIADWVATVRDTDNLPLGVVRRPYTIIQNAELAEFQRALLDVSEGSIEVAGSLFGAKIVWILSHIPKDVLIAGDQIKAFFLLTASHNATLPVTGKITPTRVVCRNTLDMALAGAGNQFKFKHTSGWQGKLIQAQEVLGVTFKYLDQFKKAGEVLAKAKMTHKQILAFTETLFPWAGDPDKVPTRTAHRREAVLALLAGADNLTDIRGTQWGVYNAVAEYVDHSGTFRETDNGTKADNRALSILTGQASLLKAQALKILQGGV